MVMRTASLTLGLAVWVVSSVATAQTKPLVLIDGDATISKFVKAELSPVFATAPMGKPEGKELKDVCSAAGASAIVQARAARGFYSLQTLNCADASVLDSQDFKIPKKFKALPAGVGDAIVIALKKARPVAPAESPAAAPAPVKAEPAAEPAPVAKSEPAPAPVEKKVEVAEAAPATEATSSAPAETATPVARPTFRASIGLRGVSRTFTVAGDPSQSVGTYDRNFHGSVLADAQLFPAASLTTSFAGNIGIFGQGEFGVGISARPLSSDTRFAGSAQRFRLGAMVRIPVSAAEIHVHAGYSMHAFAIAGVATDGVTLRPNLPSVAYNGFRGGAGLRVPFNSTVGLDVNLGVVVASRLGEIASAAFFPKASAFGLDGMAGLSFRIVDGFEARVMFDYARYMVRLNPQEGGASTATGAADQYLGGTVSLGWAL